MNSLHLKCAPVAKAGMFMRRPAADVFAAFIDPDIATRFWFTKSSGRLEVGKQGIVVPIDHLNPIAEWMVEVATEADTKTNSGM